MGGKGFRQLQVWQRSKALAVLVYKSTDSGRIVQDYGLRDQMRRAAVSVCSNIAEGDERDSDRDSARFFSIAKGSLAELITQIEIAGEIGYLSAEKTTELVRESEDIGKMLGALIRARRQK